MSLDFYAQVRGFIEKNSGTQKSKKRKTAYEYSIKRNEQSNNKDEEDDTKEYNFIRANEINKEELEFLKLCFTEFAGILHCTVRGGKLINDWGWIINDILDEDGYEFYDEEDEEKEYYIFLNPEYWFYYLMYSANGDTEKIKKVFRKNRNTRFKDDYILEATSCNIIPAGGDEYLKTSYEEYRKTFYNEKKDTGKDKFLDLQKYFEVKPNPIEDEKDINRNK